MTQPSAVTAVNEWEGSTIDLPDKLKNEKTAIYEPRKQIKDSPLDYYISETPLGKSHLISGTEYRNKISKLNRDSSMESIKSICHHKEISIMCQYDVASHFLTKLADIGFDGIDILVPDIHTRREESAFRMIPGSPLTVFQSSLCDHCQRKYISQYETESVVEAVKSVTESSTQTENQ